MSETVKLGDGPEVRRMGFGTMRLPGSGVWGEPEDAGHARAVLRKAADLGMDFFDTADSYGPFVAEDLLREELFPYEGLTVATKAGLIRTAPGEWHRLGRPEYLRFALEMSLRRLGVERIDLFQLHRIDPQVPAEDQIGELKGLKDEGKISEIGLSEVSVEEIEMARGITPIASVQNHYNLSYRSADDVVEYCEEHGIAFIPWFPMAAGELTDPDGPLEDVATETGATPAQLSLAWLLHRSPVILPIPGTNSIEHLIENVAATDVEITDGIAARLVEIADRLVEIADRD